MQLCSPPPGFRRISMSNFRACENKYFPRDLIFAVGNFHTEPSRVHIHVQKIGLIKNKSTRDHMMCTYGVLYEHSYDIYIYILYNK